MTADEISERRTDTTPDTEYDRPNILWVVMDDVCPWMSCYGDTAVETEHVDALADRGSRFDRAYATAPVCTPSRSAIITGMYQTAIGAHNHYSSFGEWRGQEMERWDPTHLGVRTIPEIFRSAGYYTFNEGKNHYNFVDRDGMLYDRKGTENRFRGAEDGTEWSGRDPDQPFFGQIQLRGGKADVSSSVTRVDPSAVTVPPYYPDHPVYREEIAHHYDTIQEMNRILGTVVETLKEDGLYENTVVCFFADHGMRLPRHKQFLYEGGVRIPLVMAGPGVPEGAERTDLVSGIDIGPTSLALAGIDVPDHVHGADVFSETFHRDHVIAARDRCDYTNDRIRAVITDRYKYVRNFMTDRPYLQPQYRDGREYMTVLNRLHEEGELDEVQSQFASEERPAEELYDLQADPHETDNIVHSTRYEHAEALGRLRTILSRWILETDDKGRYPESDDSLAAVIQRWGDDAVNDEYDRVR
ncbi:sulfatase family protein [Halomontanus rarus]|uniref:sulfatase family protein n=1 Tax=Halomontanus rarus TaxID=3034020 RepID=UPI0023E83F72|nr:sulfatase [Halovivax sp. TS33]